MNVLLIASDSTLADMLRTVGLRVTAAGQPALSELARPGSRAPELLVVDHHGKGSLPDILGQVRRQHPAMGILVVLSELDGARVLEAMRARDPASSITSMALSGRKRPVRYRSLNSAAALMDSSVMRAL